MFLFKILKIYMYSQETHTKLKKQA